MRRLEVTFAGYWYTALTIGLGVVALISANNVLYLIESLLLSGMIFSGILSERSISALEVEVRRGSASAGVPARDWIRVKNQRRYPLFCLEVGEWHHRKFIQAAFIPRIGARAECLLKSQVQYNTRGIHQWEGIAIATSYPFGLARKIKVISSPGQRIVWPKQITSEQQAQSEGESGASVRHGQEISEGEVRPFTYEDDCRDIVWNLSSKGTGPLVRARKARESEPRVTLDLRKKSGPEFEQTIAQAASPFFKRMDEEGALILIDDQGKRTIRGRHAALNQLAVAQAVGTLERRGA